ncbi:MAG: noncanonical pyrimidine nucleotidase, YjjG family, partial [Clostridia bacterium]|nr:noncanonical pyrimidine nucleotidase, YjjG family [Clostridia bacterium]
MNRRYDVLLCDADNTIFDFNKAEENAFEAACGAAGIPATQEMLSLYSEINDALWKLFEQGGIEQKVLRVRRFEQFLERIRRSDVNAGAMSEAFVEALGGQSVP